MEKRRRRRGASLANSCRAVRSRSPRCCVVLKLSGMCFLLLSPKITFLPIDPRPEPWDGPHSPLLAPVVVGLLARNATAAADAPAHARSQSTATTATTATAACATEIIPRCRARLAPKQIQLGPHALHPARPVSLGRADANISGQVGALARILAPEAGQAGRSEEHTSELQSQSNL